MAVRQTCSSCLAKSQEPAVKGNLREVRISTRLLKNSFLAVTLFLLQSERAPKQLHLRKRSYNSKKSVNANVLSDSMLCKYHYSPFSSNQSKRNQPKPEKKTKHQTITRTRNEGRKLSPAPIFKAAASSQKESQSQRPPLPHKKMTKGNVFEK